MMNDLQYILRYRPEEIDFSFLLNQTEKMLSKLPEQERINLSKKTVLWLNTSKILSGEFCGADGEYYWEAVYEVHELQKFIDKHINPKIDRTSKFATYEWSHAWICNPTGKLFITLILSLVAMPYPGLSPKFSCVAKFQGEEIGINLRL